MKHKRTLLSIMLLIGLKGGLLNAGEIRLVRAFQTWNAGIIMSTDPASIVYHPPSGHLLIADSEIDEIDGVWNCANIFVVNLAGDQVFNTFDSYVNNGLACDNPDATPYNIRRDREPTGITFNEFDGFFYITNDDRTRIMRYNATFGEAVAAEFVQGADLEGITSDPSTGYLYVLVGGEGTNNDGISRVLVYSSNLKYLSEFSVDDRIGDPEGIAYNQQLNHLFLVSQSDLKIFEYTLRGNFVTDFDISSLYPTPIDPQGLTFAPSSDPHDNPRNFNLYIVDGQTNNDPDPALDRDGIIYEVEIVKPEIWPYAVFADNGVKFEGSGAVNGDVHANNSVKYSRRVAINGKVTSGKYISPLKVDWDFYQRQAHIAGQMIRGDKIFENNTYTGVWYVTGTAFINQNANIKGTIVADNDIKIQSAENVTIQATPSNYPALVSGNSIIIEKRIAGLKGVVYACNNIKPDKNFEGRGALIAAATVDVKKKISFTFDDTYTTNIAGMSFLGTLQSRSSVTNGNKENNEEEFTPVVSNYELHQNYPNPFNPETQISFHLPMVTHIVMKIYNIRGQEILKLIDRTYAAGLHTVRWEGKDNYDNPVPSGVYFYQLQTGEFSQVKKMSLVK